MTRTRKLYESISDNPGTSVSFRDFERLLKAFGFQLDRMTGSHRQYVHPKVPRPLPVQPERKDAESYQVRQLLAMIQTYGLSIEDD